MSLVYRSDKKPEHIRSVTQDTVGPGSYNTLKDKNFNLAYVPFNSSSQKDYQKKDKFITPGPGTYQNTLNKYGEKIVVSSTNEDIKIVEVPKQLACFKSNSKRFPEKKTDNSLGPQSYEVKNNLIESSIVKPSNAVQEIDKLNLIQTISKINRYQSIPSIPSKTHSYGYTEGKHNDLELNKVPFKQYTGKGQDKIGPGHYDYQNQFKNGKGTAWSKYTSRNQKARTAGQPSVGPGQYDVQTTYIPLFKMKQSPGFASQSMRALNQRKGQVAQKLIKQKQMKDQMSVGGPGQQAYDIADLQEDEIPAPWHYQNEQTVSSLNVQKKEEKFQFFGSSADRFQKQQTNNEIGPAQYDPKNQHLFGTTIHPIKVKNPPFLSSNTRFQVQSLIDSKPAPGQYDFKNNTLEEKLIKKIQKGYRGNFGSSNQRFQVNQSQQDIPGPGQYTKEKQELEQEEYQPTFQFKSKDKRDIISTKAKHPPVGAYNIDVYDMSRQFNKVEEEEEDPELMIKKPGFMSSAPRFSENQALSEQETEDTIVQRQQFEQSVNKQQKNAQDRQVKDSGFNTKALRFNYKVKSHQPGPGSYSNVQNQWNKRTYNILYAEI